MVKWYPFLRECVGQRMGVPGNHCHTRAGWNQIWKNKNKVRFVWWISLFSPHIINLTHPVYLLGSIWATAVHSWGCEIQWGRLRLLGTGVRVVPGPGYVRAQSGCLGQLFTSAKQRSPFPWFLWESPLVMVGSSLSGALSCCLLGDRLWEIRLKLSWLLLRNCKINNSLTMY